jgi:hypothetical protein
MLSKASAPLQYRSLTEIARLSPLPRQLPSLVYSYWPALQLAIRQAGDGTWGKSMLGVPETEKGTHAFVGVGTINAVRRLLEYGWDRDAPTLLSARRILFRLLAEDDDPNFLFEFAERDGDPDLTHRGRVILREAAAATLAQAGYENDPRLRGAAKRILERVAEFLSSPLAEKPWIRLANRHVIAPEASPPSVHVLMMLGHMPHFRNEHHVVVDMLYEYLSRPFPRQELQQVVGKHVVLQPHFVLGDPLATRNVADADIPFALLWLETTARLGFLRRNENWSRLFERFLDERGREHFWRPDKNQHMLETASPYIWPTYPLQLDGPDALAADVTFRLGLIARLSGRTVELV